MQEIALHIMDIVQNSIAAEAGKIFVKVKVDNTTGRLAVIVLDNGTGMDKEMLGRVTSPFVTTRTTRKVGLGISLFKAGAEAAGGRFKIESKIKEGTQVMAEYSLSHIDRPPLGDLAGVFYTLALSNPEIDFEFVVYMDEKKFECNMAEIKETLGGVPLNTPEVSLWLNQYLKEGIDEIFGGLY